MTSHYLIGLLQKGSKVARKCGEQILPKAKIKPIFLVIIIRQLFILFSGGI